MTENHEIDRITKFLTDIFTQVGKTQGAVAVSGGIDSAVSLTLLTRALGPEHVHPLMLPYGDQSVEDSKAVIELNKIPQRNWREVNVKPVVDVLQSTLGEVDDKVRLGNLMARVRMIIVYDLAKQLDALVCGTENKSEMYLGYFTRFGDEASDIEPIQHLFKTEVRQLAAILGVPQAILTKAPSAGLWPGQTDENEMGFSYEEADRVLAEYEKQGEAYAPTDELSQKVLAQVKRMHFKHVVPYTLSSNILNEK